MAASGRVRPVTSSGNQPLGRLLVADSVRPLPDGGWGDSRVTISACLAIRRISSTNRIEIDHTANLWPILETPWGRRMQPRLYGAKTQSAL